VRITSRVITMMPRGLYSLRLNLLLSSCSTPVPPNNEILATPMHVSKLSISSVQLKMQSLLMFYSFYFLCLNWQSNWIVIFLDSRSESWQLPSHTDCWSHRWIYQPLLTQPDQCWPDNVERFSKSASVEKGNFAFYFFVIDSGKISINQIIHYLFKGV